MPIDYRKYPKNWLSEIRPRILKRAGNKCEKCGLENNQIVFAVRFRGRSKWYQSFEDANSDPNKTFESKRNNKTGKVEDVPNPKSVKVVLTIAHLDHDETNHDVSDERLMAMCQMCHLRYDGKEKYLRINKLK